jgi:hypothetical protein
MTQNVPIFVCYADTCVYDANVVPIISCSGAVCGDSEPPKPEKKSRMEELLDSLEPGRCDPVILQRS